MPELLVVTGPPGAGKSTVARILAARFERSALVEGDAFFGFLLNGAIEPWRPESREQNTTVIRAAAASAGELARGCPTVYDGVVGPWFLPTFLAASGLPRLDYVVLLPTLDRCLDRVATRIGHGFTDAGAARQMHAEFVAARIDDRHVLSDLPDFPEEAADAVLDAQLAGQLTYRG